MLPPKKVTLSPLHKRRAWLRLAFALVVALDLHLLLIFLVPITPPKHNQRQPLILEARILPPKIKALANPKPALPEPKKIESEPESPPEPASPVGQETKQAEPESVHQLSASAQAKGASSLPSLDIPLISDPSYYSAGQVDVRPEALDEIKPEYPEAADDIGGVVILVLLIDETGAVKDVTVEEANPPGVFEESAINAFKDARFSPAFKDSNWVRSRVKIRVRYEPN